MRGLHPSGCGGSRTQTCPSPGIFLTFGEGVGVGMDVVAVLRVVGAAFGTAPRAPLRPGSDAFEKQLCVLLGRDRLSVSSREGFLAPLPLVGHKEEVSVTVRWGMTSFCMRRFWTAVHDALIALQLGKSKGWSVCSAQDCTRGTS